MSDELKPPILLKAIPKQRVTVGAAFRLDLTEYVQNSITEEENFGEDVAIGLLYSVENEDDDVLPPDLDYTITGEVYGQLRPPALEYSPYQLKVTVSNGSEEPLETTFELEVLPALTEEDAWSIDESLADEFSDEVMLTEEEEQELFKTLKEEAEKTAGQFTEEKQAIWQAILQGQTIPEIQSLMDRPITHQEIYYLLGRMAYFVIWDAHNPAPAGELYPLRLQGIEEHFNVYDRGSCIVATPKHLFDHNRTLLHAVNVSQAMAHEVFKRGWTVEFGGFDKMVRAAWVEFELLSEKYEKPVKYSYFNPSPHDVDILIQAKNIRLK
jgi:hypothetical protein